MKFAIISNVDKSDDKFVTGSKTIRSIISITPENKFIEEKINGQITRIEFKLAAEVKDKIDGILLNHIETHIGKKIPIGVTSTEAGLFLTKIKEKYVLSCQEETVGGWFGTTTKQAKEIGKYSVMPLDNDYSVEALEAERLKELMGIITSARNDRNQLPQFLCFLASQEYGSLRPTSDIERRIRRRIQFLRIS